MTSGDRLAWFEATLEQAGLRRTVPRHTLLQLLAATERPLCAQDLYEQAGATINLVTIYRTLNELTRLKLLSRIEFGEGFYRYAPVLGPSEPNRHYLICDRCGVLTDFEGCLVDPLLPQAILPNHFQVTYHTLVLHGICEHCQTL